MTALAPHRRERAPGSALPHEDQDERGDALEIGVRIAAFVLILVGAALIPAPVRAGAALGRS